MLISIKYNCISVRFEVYFNSKCFLEKYLTNNVCKSNFKRVH